jgi:hypothetical protein
MRTLLALFALLALLTLSSACGAPYYIANNASAELNCPEGAIKVRQVGGSFGSRRGVSRYVASGCGQSIAYTCVGDDCRAP